MFGGCRPEKIHRRYWPKARIRAIRNDGLVERRRDKFMCAKVHKCPHILATNHVLNEKPATGIFMILWSPRNQTHGVANLGPDPLLDPPLHAGHPASGH